MKNILLWLALTVGLLLPAAVAVYGAAAAPDIWMRATFAVFGWLVGITSTMVVALSISESRRK